MAPTRQMGRNYRRKQTFNSSPEDSDREFQLLSTPPPLRVAPSFAHLTLSSADSGSDSISSATLKRVTGDGDEGREEEADGGRIGKEGDEGGGIGGREANREVSRSVRGSPNGGRGSSGPLTKREVLQDSAKRIGSGVGYNMLKSMGWRENTGLGQSRNGIVDPILPTAKPNHLGIGFNPTAAHDAAQEEIRQIQKSKREKRDRKLQEKVQLEKAEAAEEEATFMRESFVAVPSTYEHLHELGVGPQGNSSKSAGHKRIELRQCPHCKQRFDTKHALKSHINARHSRLLLAVKRQVKNKRRFQREGGRKSNSSGRQSARSLAPLSQDFSVYD